MIRFRVQDESVKFRVENATVVQSGNIGELKIDDTLRYVNGVLGVNTATIVEPDNTLPITSAAVDAVVGNIGAVLDTI